VTEDTTGAREPDAGYAGADFDRYFADAARSPALNEIFATHFDPAAPPSVRGFCFVTMAGLERVAELLVDPTDGPLLDVGCGRGGPGLWLAGRLGRPLRGVDISRVAIAQARAAAARRGAQATFSEGSLDDTRLPDDAVSTTVCLDALHFAVDPAAAATELLRVTRPGGVLVLTTWQTSSGPPRLRLDLAATLRDAGWSVELTEEHPDWLAAQLRLYVAAREAPTGDPAVARLRTEGDAVSSAIRTSRRLLIRAVRP
jgi:SAM-dependent methyltransferase